MSSSLNQVPLRRNLLAQATALTEWGDYQKAFEILNQASELPVYFQGEENLFFDSVLLKSRIFMLQGFYLAAVNELDGLPKRDAHALVLSRKRDLESLMSGSNTLFLRCSKSHQEIMMMDISELKYCLDLPESDPSLLRVIFELGEHKESVNSFWLQVFLDSDLTRVAALEALGKTMAVEDFETIGVYLSDSDLFVKRTAFHALASSLRRLMPNQVIQTMWLNKILQQLKSGQHEAALWLDMIDAMAACRNLKALPVLDMLQLQAERLEEGDNTLLKGSPDWTELIDFSVVLSEAVKQARLEIMG